MSGFENSQLTVASPSSTRGMTHENPHISHLRTLLAVDLNQREKVMQAARLITDVVYQAILDGSGLQVAAAFTPEDVERFQAIHTRYEFDTDDRFMTDVQTGVATRADQYPFQMKDDRLAALESRLAGMKRGEPVVHIGTGWPGTAIGLYRQFGVPVICVEIDPIIATRSKKALQKLNLYGEDKLQVVAIDGCRLNIANFNNIIISAMVPNRDKISILHNIRDLLVEEYDDSPNVIIRKPPDAIRELIFQSCNEIDTYPNLGNLGMKEIARTIPGDNDPILSTVYRLRRRAEVGRGGDRFILAAQERLVFVGSLEK